MGVSYLIRLLFHSLNCLLLFLRQHWDYVGLALLTSSAALAPSDLWQENKLSETRLGVTCQACLSPCTFSLPLHHPSTNRPFQSPTRTITLNLNTI